LFLVAEEYIILEALEWLRLRQVKPLERTKKKFGPYRQSEKGKNLYKQCIPIN
jgi:hypothetical protein